ncbi:MAG: hypothetical protein H6835_21115, partial [Planctomycetes bacterium]|nr:hypothetical protein [Planctomycetota bacterium]
KLEDAGWEELSDATVPEPRRKQHAEWTRDPAPALRALQAKRDDINVESLRGGFNVEGFRRQVARLRAAGLEPIYVVMPHYALNFYGREAIAELREEVTILEMDVPQAFEDVYEFANWYDWAHLMRPGAEVFTRRLADECAKRFR